MNYRLIGIQNSFVKEGNITVKNEESLENLIYRISECSVVYHPSFMWRNDLGLVLRFVITDNCIKWYVPFSEVKATDWIETYELDEIEFRQVGGLGATYLDIMRAVLELVDWIGRVQTGISVVKFSKEQIEKFVKKYMILERGYLSPNDVEKFIQRKEKWNINVFSLQIGIQDISICKVILNYYGYLTDNEIDYYFNEKYYLEHKVDFVELC